MGWWMVPWSQGLDIASKTSTRPWRSCMTRFLDLNNFGCLPTFQRGCQPFQGVANLSKGVIMWSPFFGSQKTTKPWYLRCTFFPNPNPTSQKGHESVVKHVAFKDFLGGGFKYLLFSPGSLGKWSNLTCAYFYNGLKSPTSLVNNKSSKIFPHPVLSRLRWEQRWMIVSISLH